VKQKAPQGAFCDLEKTAKTFGFCGFSISLILTLREKGKSLIFLYGTIVERF